jgi:hypothetical protein
MDLLLKYATITVRMVFYRLVSIFDYPNDRRFYKRLGYSLKRVRKYFATFTPSAPTQIAIPPVKSKRHHP